MYKCFTGGSQCVPFVKAQMLIAGIRGTLQTVMG